MIAGTKMCSARTSKCGRVFVHLNRCGRTALCWLCVEGAFFSQLSIGPNLRGLEFDEGLVGGVGLFRVATLWQN